jgi:ATP-dependent DNA helicase DinG
MHGSKPGGAYLPPPSTFGITGFDTWRKGQDQAANGLVLSPSKYDMMVCPTGFGKSLMYITAAVLSGKRTLILTSTNGLLDQLLSDFGDLCAVIKGKSNYRCRKIGHGVGCDRGPCNWGQSCAWKDGGCHYYDAVSAARSADIVISNYAYWVYNNKARDGGGRGDEAGAIGEFEWLVCDEAHDVTDRVADAYTVRFSKRNDVERYLLQGYHWTDDHADVMVWAKQALGEADRIYKDAKRDNKTERTFQASNAKRKLRDVVRQIATDTDGSNTVIVPEKKYGVLRVAVAWPFDKAQSVLFRESEKIIFTSATVRPKTVQMLGVDADSVECTLHEYPHIIPQHRRMLYHIPTLRLNYRTSDVEMRRWLTRIDQIIKPRRDRNGIIHPVSYSRRNLILKRSKYSNIMMSHGTKDAAQVIELFKEQTGRVLVSPSVTTGYDFPYDTCRYQIIGKIAYPDTSDPVTKARCTLDDEYGPYIAMQTLVQTVGRPVRAEDDWAESFIIDDNIKWFVWRYERFAPQWFMGSYKSVGSVPAPAQF